MAGVHASANGKNKNVKGEERERKEGRKGMNRRDLLVLILHFPFLSFCLLVAQEMCDVYVILCKIFFLVVGIAGLSSLIIHSPIHFACLLACLRKNVWKCFVVLKYFKNLPLVVKLIFLAEELTWELYLSACLRVYVIIINQSIKSVRLEISATAPTPHHHVSSLTGVLSVSEFYKFNNTHLSPFIHPQRENPHHIYGFVYFSRCYYFMSYIE